MQTTIIIQDKSSFLIEYIFFINKKITENVQIYNKLLMRLEKKSKIM